MHGTQLSSLRAKAPLVPLGDAGREAKRDLRIDFFRGLSLFFIYIDHIQDNVLSYFTLQSVAFADAAEVFVFISGYTAAVVYGRAMRREGKVFAIAQIYRRVWQLYLAHVVVFVMFTAEVSLAILTSHSYGEDFGISGFLPQASPHFSGMLSNKRIKKAENLSEKNRNAPIDGEDRHERPERVEY
jgi:hypothetical protein